jgi:hypothetical protein
MAEYINIKGQNIEVVASDPANPTLGQIWYNSTSNTLKGQIFQAAAWATGGSLGTGRYSRATFGIQTNAVIAGGSPPATTAVTELYDGTSWSPSGNLNTSRRGLAGCGVQTAGLAFGGTTGATTAATEEYNGSTWTSVTGLPQAVRQQFGAGVQTAAFASGGFLDPPNAPINNTYEYDGSVWTAGGTMGTGRTDGQACGILTAALAVGGRDSNPPPVATPPSNNVEEYDGTSWTAGGGYPVGMNAIGVSGNQTAAIAFGGNTGGAQSAANLYDGTSWTATTALNTARGYVSGCGTQTAGLAVGDSTTTEEFTSAGPATKTITAS